MLAWDARKRLSVFWKSAWHEAGANAAGSKTILTTTSCAMIRGSRSCSPSSSNSLSHAKTLDHFLERRLERVEMRLRGDEKHPEHAAVAALQCKQHVALGNRLTVLR